MNKILLSFYACNVIENIGILLIILTIVGICLLAISAIIFCVWYFNEYQTNREEEQYILAGWKQIFKIGIPILCVMSGILVVLPSKKVMYSFVGLKTVEYVISETATGKYLTEESIKLVKDVSEIVHSYAEDLKKKDQ